MAAQQAQASPTVAAQGDVPSYVQLATMYNELVAECNTYKRLYLEKRTELNRTEAQRGYLIERVLATEGLLEVEEENSDDASSRSSNRRKTKKAKKSKRSSRKKKGASDSGTQKRRRTPADKPTPEEEAASAANAAKLRAQGLLCSATSRSSSKGCNKKPHEGSKYCWLHQPLDPNSKLMFCHFKGAANDRPCKVPIPKLTDFPYCKYHKEQGAEAMGIPVPEIGDDGTVTFDAATAALVAAKKAADMATSEAAHPSPKKPRLTLSLGSIKKTAKAGITATGAEAPTNKELPTGGKSVPFAGKSVAALNGATSNHVDDMEDEDES